MDGQTDIQTEPIFISPFLSKKAGDKKTIIDTYGRSKATNYMHAIRCSGFFLTIS
jgi:hypothetical protein